MRFFASPKKRTPKKGDTVAAERALAYLREHRADAETIYVDALVDAGDLDAAARELIAQLASEDDQKRAETDVQKVTDRHIAEVDALVAAKEQEIMAV